MKTQPYPFNLRWLSNVETNAFLKRKEYSFSLKRNKSKGNWVDIE